MAYIGFLIFRAFGKLLALLPLRLLYCISDFFYLVVFYIVKYRKKVVYDNLRNSFPEKTEAEIDTIARKFYHHFCDILVEIVKLLHIPSSEIKKRIIFRNPEVLAEEYARKKHIMAVISHHNNWEWGQALALHTPYKTLSVYRPLNNKYFDELMIKLRCQFGGEVVTMKKTARAVAEKVNGNNPYVFNFISDQSPYHSEIQYWGKFLNQETPVNLGAEKIAKAAKQPVYFAKMIKVKRGYYEVELIKICDDGSIPPSHEVTDKHLAILESIILENPEYYLWTHRRWKHKRPQE